MTVGPDDGSTDASVGPPADVVTGGAAPDAASDAVSGTVAPGVRHATAGARPHGWSVRPLVVGCGGAAVAGVLAGVDHASRPVFAGVLLLAQVGFTLGWVVLLDPADRFGAALIAAAAAAAADVLLLTSDRVLLGDFAAILAVAFLVSIAHQLFRPHRSRVTEALAATLAAVVLDVTGAVYVALRGVEHGGRQATAVALVSVGAALLAGRLVDAALARPAVSASGRRGLPGAVVSLAAGIGAGAGYSGTTHVLTSATGVTVAAVAAVLAVCTDLGVDLGLTTMGGERRRGRGAAWARLAVAAVLPVLLAAAPAYAMVRVTLS